MTTRKLVYSVAQGIKSDLIYKVEKFITKRQALLGQSNNFTLDRLAKIISQTNQQLTYTVNKSDITQIQDLTNIPFDRFMSVPDNRVIKVKQSQPHFSRFSSVKQRSKNSIGNSIAISRRDSQRSRPMTPQSKSVPGKRSNHSSKSKVMEPLKVEKTQEQERYVQAMRQDKKKEYQERCLKQMKMTQALKKKKLENNWSEKKVMFDFECKAIKIQELKPQKYFNLESLEPQVDPNSNITKIYTREPKSQFNQQVKNKVNITLKTQQEEEAKLKRKGIFKPNQSNRTQTQAPFFILNLQSHEQTKNAIRLQSDAVKIKFNDKYLSTKTEPQEISKLTINSRMNRTQYFEFKKAQQSRKNRLLSSQLRPRSKSEMKVRTECSMQQNGELKMHAKMSLLKFNSTRRDSSKSNQSKVNVYNGQLHKELLTKQEKHCAKVKAEEKQDSTPKIVLQRLSQVDKYNLMYIKHNGNPPADCLKSLTETLKTTSTMYASKQRQNLLKTATSKKYNWINSNRIIDIKKQKTLKTTKLN